MKVPKFTVYYSVFRFHEGGVSVAYLTAQGASPTPLAPSCTVPETTEKKEDWLLSLFPGDRRRGKERGMERLRDGGRGRALLPVKALAFGLIDRAAGRVGA